MQDYLNIEYIFVDGGSDDGTKGIIQSIRMPVVFVSDVRGGISAAMNKGIELATGDVIAHLHGDDYYLHSKVLSKVARVLADTRAGWCFGRAKDDIDGEIRDEQWAVPKYSYKRLKKGNFIPHQATFVRSRVFSELGVFDTKYSYAMDYDMWLRIGRRYEPAQINEHLVAFRRHDGSISTANEMSGMAEDFFIRLKYVDKTPWSYGYHFAHFLVRRIRLAKKLRKKM
jgi:glycosyltransferase involved in cell wall biosynthesis